MTTQTATFASNERPSHATQSEPLPPGFGRALRAFAEYLDRHEPAVPAPAATAALEDLLALFAEAAQDGIPLRAVVGHDPADVAEALLANHAPAAANAQARTDLARAIDLAAGPT